jgi:hypothetical protein
MWAAYAGLTPRERTSGHCGAASRALGEDGRQPCAWRALFAGQRGDAAQPDRLRLRRAPAGTRHTADGDRRCGGRWALRKLLHLIYGVRKSERPFDEALRSGSRHGGLSVFSPQQRNSVALALTLKTVAQLQRAGLRRRTVSLSRLRNTIYHLTRSPHFETELVGRLPAGTVRCYTPTSISTRWIVHTCREKAFP